MTNFKSHDSPIQHAFGSVHEKKTRKNLVIEKSILEFLYGQVIPPNGQQKKGTEESTAYEQRLLLSSSQSFLVLRRSSVARGAAASKAQITTSSRQIASGFKSGN